MKLIKVKCLFVASLILLGCLETLQLFNKFYALSTGKKFLKTHNATVESIDCYIPGSAALDQSGKICTFKATQRQIQVLIKNIGFRPVDTRISDEELGGISDEFDRKAKTKELVDVATRTKLHDWRRSLSIETKTCWITLSLKNRSELELYGTSEDKKSKFREDFYIFYKKSNATGCFVFSLYLEGEPGMYGSN